MSGLLQEPRSPQEYDGSRWTIIVAVGVVFAVALGTAFFLRARPKPAATPNAYAATVKLSNIKMSTAQNFVGATVTYIDGTITNGGNETLSHAVAHVVFRDSMGQVAQADDVPLRVLKDTGPYPDAVDLSLSPLAPGQSQQFRLTFEHVSNEWNQAYPELQVTDVTVRQVY